ncbi:MAG: NADH dehydrogenase (quinone) subunit D, partial [Armatimonadota bacterium]
TLVINMGPQHPSCHGVLRLLLELDGETVVKCTPDIGFLHTGMEKTMENLNYQQAVTVTDRMDYMAPLSNNLGYCLAVEKLLGIEAPPRATVARVMLVELQRIASHLLWVGSHAFDLGATTPFLYGLRDRELCLDVFEECSGQRMMTSYIRVGGLSYDLPEGIEEKVGKAVTTIRTRLSDLEDILTANPIWIQRTQGVGVLSAEDAVDLGVTGPMLRASGVAWDLRKTEPYCGYEDYDFEIALGRNGDTYDRYLVRMEEIRQSLRIVEQALNRLPAGDYRAEDRKVSPPPKPEIDESMEALIHHFKLVTEGFRPPAGEVYQAIESPRGEIGFYVASDGSGKPYRVRVRAPSFVNLQALPKLAEGRLIADVVALIATIDPIMGEVDR